MNEKYAAYLLEKTKDDYNTIADHYAGTRSFISPDLKKVGSYASDNEKVLDLGCANGRLIEIFKGRKIDFFGVDFSDKLIDLAKNKYPSACFKTADALDLPFPNNYFDKVYSISVLHHIPSQDKRIKYLKESYRVLKPGGWLILRVWNFWQKKEGWKLFFNYALLKLAGRSKMDFYDILLPWKNSQGQTIVERYFHCFTKRRLARLAKQAGFSLKKKYIEGQGRQSNIYIIAEK